jgi:hypothetical protein
MEKVKNRRKHVRFEPDSMTYAQIDLDAEHAEFRPTHIGLLIEEGHKGCGCAVSSRTQLKKGAFCKIKAGELPVFKSEVRWVIRLDKDILKVGFEYLE